MSVTSRTQHACPIRNYHGSPAFTLVASFSENNVSVRAFTSAGPGDAAMATFMTGEDSELLSNAHT